MTWLDYSLIFYICGQLLNVILSTVRYILTVKSKPVIAAIANAASYTIGAIITYFLVKQSIIAVIAVTFFSNLLGVPIGMFFVNKFSKDRLWIYNATINCTEEQAFEIKHKLKDNDVDVIYEEIIVNVRYSFRMFAQSKEDSKNIINEIEKNHGKYYVVEPR